VTSSAQLNLEGVDEEAVPAASVGGDFAFESEGKVRRSSKDLARLAEASGSEGVGLVEEDMVTVSKVRCLNVEPVSEAEVRQLQASAQQVMAKNVTSQA
jgi:hypothetical protein